MPLANRVLSTAGKGYGHPLDGATERYAQIAVNITLLTTAEVDADGYIKPGVMLTKAGVLPGAAPAYTFGVVVESIKVADGNDATSLAAASTTFQLGVATSGNIRRPIVEDNLGRVMSANELAAAVAAGSQFTLLG